MRKGVRVAVDVGTVRIGVAVSDPGGLVAAPAETVSRGRGDLARLAAVVTDRAAVEVLVGLPRSLSGSEGPAAWAARRFAAELAATVRPVPVRMVDERLSTLSATRALRAAGLSGRRARTVVDQAAAVEFLQAALDAEQNTGFAPGDLVAPEV